MSGPIFNEKYSENECLQLMTSKRKVEVVTDFTAITEIALKAPSAIVLANGAAGLIAFRTVSNGTTYIKEYFTLGQKKDYRVTHIGGTTEGTGGTITQVNIWES